MIRPVQVNIYGGVDEEEEGQFTICCPICGMVFIFKASLKIVCPLCKALIEFSLIPMDSDPSLH